MANPRRGATIDPRTHLDAFLDGLEGVIRKGDDRADARCPAHDDRQQSLSVGAGDEGLILRCHAGCTPTDVVAARGWTLSQLFYDANGQQEGPIRLTGLPRPAATAERKVSHRRVDTRATLPPVAALEHWAKQIQGDVTDRLIAIKGWTEPTLAALGIGWDGERITIPVRDADGMLVQVMRYLPGGKPKIRALSGRGRHLFPAPETVEGETLWLLEGEPDSISARELGLPAVAVPGVATWKTEWASRFAGRRVVVCLDCDEEGRRAAQLRVADLIRAGVTAWLVDLAPDRDDGTDVSDLLAIATAEGRLGDLRAYLGRLEREAVGDA